MDIQAMASPTSNDIQNTSLSPEAPKLKTTDLPDVEDETTISYSITDENELSTLPPLETYEMNQNLLDETVSDRPLIAPLTSISVLRTEYEGGSQVFVNKIDWLIKNGYVGIRRTRGDGDCFYRSLAFTYIEHILLAPDTPLAVTRAISALESTQPLLDDAGFEKLAYEDFYDCFISLINNIIMPEGNGRLLTPAILLEAFNIPEVSNSIVAYLRLLTSAQIRADPSAYEAFLFHPELNEPLELRGFCENFVEVVGKEADHPQITALSRALKVNINVAYLDGHSQSNEGKVDFVEFQNTDEAGVEPMILLYRPGHYDILDRRSEESFE